MLFRNRLTATHVVVGFRCKHQHSSCLKNVFMTFTWAKILLLTRLDGGQSNTTSLSPLWSTLTPHHSVNHNSLIYTGQKLVDSLQTGELSVFGEANTCGELGTPRSELGPEAATTVMVNNQWINHRVITHVDDIKLLPVCPVMSNQSRPVLGSVTSGTWGPGDLRKRPAGELRGNDTRLKSI